MELEQALARVVELEGQVTALAGERDAAVGLGEQLRGELGPLRSQAELATTLGVQIATVAAERDAAAAALVVAGADALTATRRALLAEHAGRVVPELIAGDSAAALEASVETAAAAFARVAEVARAATAGQPVPAGAGSGRAAPVGAGMSPMDMIAAGLNSGGGRR